MSDEPEMRGLRDAVDLDLWSAPTAPDDFEERLLRRVADERRAQRRQRRNRIGVAAVTLAFAAGLFAFVRSEASERSGGIRADRPESVAIGRHVTAVAAVGAKIAWKGDLVEQTAGDVFYRVDRGTPLVLTAGGARIDVRGTCFRVRILAAGAGTAVHVDEGEVAVRETSRQPDQANEPTLLRAGEDAVVSSAGVRRTAPGAEALVEAEPESAAMRANADLVLQIRDYRRRLERIDEQKGSLEKDLALATARLRAIDAGGAIAPNEAWNLDQDDWRELAKTGAIKFRVPCSIRGGWTPTPAESERLGLAAGGAAAVRDAYARSFDRVSSEIRPLCAERLGEVAADKLGVAGCTSAVIAMAQSESGGDDKHGTLAGAMHRVSSIRAGLQPPPATGEAVDPIAQVFLSRTAELGRLEADLARSIGPVEAHRVVFSDDACAWNESWPGLPER